MQGEKGMSKSFGRIAPIISLMVVSVFVLAACGGASSATSSKTVDVQVTLTDFKITSSLTTFSTGVPYHFTVTNKGAVSHQMVIMPPESGQLTTDQVQKLMLAGIGGEGMAAGQTRTFDYTFTQPASAGTIEFACHLPGHYDAGMHTPIVVK
jgi:uncharacterized cupredoxin-like copper-binding protein